MLFRPVSLFRCSFRSAAVVFGIVYAMPWWGARLLRSFCFFLSFLPPYLMLLFFLLLPPLRYTWQTNTKRKCLCVCVMLLRDRRTRKVKRKCLCVCWYCLIGEHKCLCVCALLLRDSRWAREVCVHVCCCCVVNEHENIYPVIDISSCPSGRTWTIYSSNYLILLYVTKLMV